MNTQEPMLGGPRSLDDRSQYSMLVRDLADALARRHWDPVETATRRQLPGVPLLPPPAWSVTYVAAGVNAMYDIDLPDSLSVLTFRALSTVEFHVGLGSRVVMPRVQQANLSGTFMAADPIVCPLDMLFYCRALR